MHERTSFSHRACGTLKIQLRCSPLGLNSPYPIFRFNDKMKMFMHNYLTTANISTVKSTYIRRKYV